MIDDHARILDALAACLDDERPQMAQDVRALIRGPMSLEAVLARLAEFEREPGLPVHLFGLIAAAKKAVSTGDDSAFWRRAWHLLGLV
ncbi:MAG: hypothetical protein SFW67_25930 [Myxococcaceae bacterium]|nr:hypothetical protein [Myxococcaceae bacterium]